MGRKNQTAAQRQETIFKFIKSFLMEQGYPPSVREIGAAVGLRSSSTVHAYLDMLEDRGLILRDPAKPRAIDILDEKPWSNNVIVPLVKNVMESEALLEPENVEEMLRFPADFVGEPDGAFIVRAKDDSMSEAGIFEGDYVLVEKKAEPANGDIVVAMLKGGVAVIRRYSTDKRGVKLSPAHKGLRASYAKANIIGKATGVYRSF